jgi:PAS domain S-box-containing protein
VAGNHAQSASQPISTAAAILAVASLSAFAILAVWFGLATIAIVAIAAAAILAGILLYRRSGGPGAAERDRQETMLRQAHRIAQLCYWQWRPHGDRRQEESDGEYIYTDDTEDLFGQDAETMAAAGGDYWDLIAHPDDRALARTRFLQFLRDQTPTHVQEYRINNPKRGERYVRECAEKAFDSAGRLIGIAGTLQDVTDARRTQHALREGEAKLRRGFRMAKLGHWSFEPNRARPDGTTGVYTYSDQVKEIYGISGDELDIGSAFYDLYIHPDDREQLRALNDSFLDDDRASYTHEYRFLRPDGKIAYIHESAEKIRDDSGRVTQIVGTIQDVTNQRLADLALRESEAKLKLGYRIAKMGHWSFDPNNRTGDIAKAPYSWSSEAAEIFGATAAEMNEAGGIFYDRYVHHDDRDDLKKLDETFLSSDVPSYVQEYRVILPDGSIRHVLESAEKRLDAAGRLIQVNGIVQDVTGLKRSAIAMRRVERQMRRAYRLAKLGYWYWESPDGGSEDVNHSQLSDEVCEIFGAERDQLYWDDGEAFCAHFVHPDDRVRLQPIATAFAREEIDS